MLFKDKEANSVQKVQICMEVKTILLTIVGIFVFSVMMTNANAAVDENPITMYPSTPDGFTNNDPHTIQTIFATVHKADLGQSGFQWQAKGQIKNTGSKALTDLNVNIQLIDSDGKIVGLVPTATQVMLSDLQPDQTTTFDGILNGNDVNANAVAFKLTFEWKG